MMKHFTLFLFFLLAVNLLSVQASKTVITLDLSQPTDPTEIKMNEEGYWEETYSSDYPFIEFGLFSFTHLYSGEGGNDVGGGLSYWDGFTLANNGDDTDHGLYGGTTAWVTNQWGCIAGGGLDNEKNTVKGEPYLVAYWGYWSEQTQNTEPCLQVRFTDGGLYQAEGVYICNHPWPYYGILNGDGFARKFEEGDYFKLFIHGYNSNGEDTGIVVEHILAEYKDGQLTQSDRWEWVDLSALGEISGLYFTMETTDTDPDYGPNTAVFFCMDKLQVSRREETGKPSRPAGLKADCTETTIVLKWDIPENPENIQGYNLYLDDTFHDSVADNSYTFTQLSPYTSYRIGIEAFDPDENLSDRGYITVSTTDETPPSIPAGLTAVPSVNTVKLAWEASTDNVGVKHYNIFQDGQRIKRVADTEYTVELLSPGTSYLLEVNAEDEAGNSSEKAAITVITLNSTGISDLPAKNVSVYFNSVTFEIIIDDPDRCFNYITVTDVHGRKIKEGKTETSVSASVWPDGIYLIRLTNGKDQGIYKIIKK